MRVLSFVTVLLLAVATPLVAEAPAGTLGNARVGFRAERVLILDGKSYIGKMWHMPGEQRHEQAFPALKAAFSLRADSVVGDAVLPQLHTIVEFALPKELSLLGDPDLLHDPIGPEKVNGIPTTKYAIDAEIPGGHAFGSLWLSEDGIPMKCDARVEAGKGKVSTIHWELRHLEIGRQDAALFEIPHGYARLPPEAVAPLLGIRLTHPAR
jgi:hypothetical protein